MVLTDEQVKNLKDLIRIQGAEGTWNYDEYLFGMYNGMELMLSVVENRKPEYKERPKNWRKDRGGN